MVTDLAPASGLVGDDELIAAGSDEPVTAVLGLSD